MILRCCLFGLALTALTACGGRSGPGSSCDDESQCVTGLTCVEGVCRDATEPDAAVIDAGSERSDAGRDSGADSGPPTPDDAGATSVDAALADAGDSGDRDDAGPGDAGTPVGEGLLYDFVAPSTGSATTVVRLGEDLFVLAYADDTDTSTVEAEQLVFQLVIRVGHRLEFGAVSRFDEVTIGSADLIGIEQIGALGDGHFFTILVGPGYARSIRYFEIDAGTVSALGSGSLPGTSPQETGGHPVDATRYILGYRQRNTGEPVEYRLLVRDGDSFRFGPPVTRPGAASFPGLASGESQIDPALLRVGPTTFVETRPGYVLMPGDLATWTLSLGPDDTLVASDPRVQETVERTMVPEVAADGRGHALVTYHSYLETDWQYGLYDHGTGVLTEIGSLGTSGSAGIRNHQGESTDRFFGGSYYLRLHGDAVSAPLFRVSADGVTVERLADAPSLWNAYQAPQMVRSGSIAAYAGLRIVRFLDLAPLCGNGAMDPDEQCDDGNNLDGDGCSAGCLTES